MNRDDPGARPSRTQQRPARQPTSETPSGIPVAFAHAAAGPADTAALRLIPERARPGRSNVRRANRRLKLPSAFPLHLSALRLVLRTQPRSGRVLEYPNHPNHRPQLRLPNILLLLGEKAGMRADVFCFRRNSNFLNQAALLEVPA